MCGVSDEPLPGQMQLVSVAPRIPNRAGENGVPRYEDIVLTAEQVDEARATWPDAAPGHQLHWMKSRILVKLRHEVVVDPMTGRRAFGGPQPGSKPKRIDESIVEAADNRRQELIDAAFAPINGGAGVTPMDRHRAALNIAREAREVRAMEMQEDELAKASGEDLEREVAKLLLEQIRSGKLDLASISGFADADVVESTASDA